MTPEQKAVVDRLMADINALAVSAADWGYLSDDTRAKLPDPIAPQIAALRTAIEDLARQAAKPLVPIPPVDPKSPVIVAREVLTTMAANGAVSWEDEARRYAANADFWRGRVEGLLQWAIDRWNAEVKHRPLVNVHRRTLDDTWRQVIRFAGGNPRDLLGLNHDELLAGGPFEPTDQTSALAAAVAGASSAWDALGAQEPPPAEPAPWPADFVQYPGGAYDAPSAAAPAVQGLTDERAAFEAWARSRGYQADEIARCTIGIVSPEYFNPNTEESWKAWQARAALATPPTQPAAQADVSRGFVAGHHQRNDAFSVWIKPPAGFNSAVVLLKVDWRKDSPSSVRICDPNDDPAQAEAKDAARYRWLRDHGFRYADVDLDPESVVFRPRFSIPEPAGMSYEDGEWTLDDIDAALDAAMAASKKEG